MNPDQEVASGIYGIRTRTLKTGNLKLNPKSISIAIKLPINSISPETPALLNKIENPDCLPLGVSCRKPLGPLNVKAQTSTVEDPYQREFHPWIQRELEVFFPIPKSDPNADSETLIAGIRDKFPAIHPRDIHILQVYPRFPLGRICREKIDDKNLYATFELPGRPTKVVTRVYFLDRKIRKILNTDISI
ncbi:hypothetical protein HOF92_03465 [bacterium]|nr:hypothetical protein [bacterium]